MTIFRLGSSPVFPPASKAEPEGLLALGGDLSSARLLAAYRSGIFPWFSEGEPILWWSPDPRCVLFPEKLRVSRSMRQVIQRGFFRVTFDHAFDRVIEGCRKPGPGRRETWITKSMREAYCDLNRLGVAHSVEAWSGDRLAGGLYGVSQGEIFFGESMFSDMANASKAAFIALVQQLRDWKYSLIDCQVHTNHLISMGAEMIPRAAFLNHLERSLVKLDRRTSWASLCSDAGA